VGEGLGPSWFNVGQWVDVKAISRGMGFAGVSGSYSIAVEELGLDEMEWENAGDDGSKI
jgi:ribosomal protein L3